MVMNKKTFLILLTANIALFLFIQFVLKIPNVGFFASAVMLCHIYFTQKAKEEKNGDNPKQYFRLRGMSKDPKVTVPVLILCIVLGIGELLGVF